MAVLLRVYRTPAASASRAEQLRTQTNALLAPSGIRVTAIDSEFCFYVDADGELTPAATEKLRWLLAETYEPALTSSTSFLEAAAAAPAASAGTTGTAATAGGADGGAGSIVVEVGPRLAFTSAFSTNAVSIARGCDLPVRRLERYRRYRLRVEPATGEAVTVAAAAFAPLVHDRMTEWRITSPLTTFANPAMPEPVRSVPLLAGGRAALEAANKTYGLSMDAWDIDFYYKLFAEELRRDATDVELFDISQSNSEHSRHWFFKGDIVIDGVTMPATLMKLVQSTLAAHPDNSIVAFADNSSAIRGFTVPLMLPATPGSPSGYVSGSGLRHCLLTAETHNFPTGVAPFPGAETGTGGRIRDTHATGRGSHVIAGTAGYCVGNLHIPGHTLPWESEGAAAAFAYPPTLASPLEIEVAASNGASDYGNKFGEPLIVGFTRSVGLRLTNGERREYVKPIMFTAGVGALDDAAAHKGAAEAGMVVVKLGGPAYRIGMGGSAASSMMQGENRADLDFNAVQRGDAEMEQKVNRVIRACCELGPRNPIVSIHDQGAGGNCNVLKEIVSPAGGRIDIRAIPVGDATLSVLEIWGAEYQESDALLVRAADREVFAALCARERAPVAFVGTVTGDGRIVVVDSADGTTPVDMDLERVLGDMPSKTFRSERATRLATAPLELPADITVEAALHRVLRLLSVGSKRFLTNKVDRSVTGLIAQQQCVGPLHIPLADFAMVALSHTAVAGVATSVGEQPLKGLASPAAMARMSVGEAITNMMGARITRLADAKCSANWMWAAKLPHEGAAMYDACAAMTAFMIATGVAVDGGKDSLSMAAKTPDGEMVKAPGTLVISLYAPCPDVSRKATPDLKGPGAGVATAIIVLDLSCTVAGTPRARWGGSALAQVYGQVGAAEEVPDCDDPAILTTAFAAVQALLDEPGLVLAAHDRSDGGLLVAALEMAFAGNCGITLDVTAAEPAAPVAAAAAGAGAAGAMAGPSPAMQAALRALFSEELGYVIEVPAARADEVVARFAAAGVHARACGTAIVEPRVVVTINGGPALDARMPALRDMWEETSFQLERRQCEPACVEAEQATLAGRRAPPYALSFEPSPTPELLLTRAASAKPRVAVVREEGTNGDREMAAALCAAGFDAWDVTMSDLLADRVRIDEAFRGVVFPGGFSYADVLDSAKGWAGVIRYHPLLLAQFTAFYRRADTFSLGVCNGCQLLALLGWVPFGPGGSHAGVTVTDATQPRFVHNRSGRFESRFSTVRINDSPAVMFAGMAGSVLGVWVAHGEGRAHFVDGAVLAAVAGSKLVPLTYVDDAGDATEVYPFNPNGSPGGIAGLTTPDGRHLAIMPHPERVHTTWQWPWMPASWAGIAGGGRGAGLAASPWLRMFQNAREWCERPVGGGGGAGASAATA